MSFEIRERILFQPWAISAEYALTYGTAVAAILEGKDPFPTLNKSELRARNKTTFISMDIEDLDPGDDEDDQLEDDAEQLDDPEEPTTDSIAVVNLRGPVLKYSQFCGPRGTMDIANELDRLRMDPKIAGAIFRIESGGGEYYAVKPLADAIKRFKAVKPIVALAGDFLCSAAYYIAVFCNEILFEHPKAVIGSIGTMISFADMKPAWIAQGVRFHEIYATESVLKNKTTSEALKGNYKPIITKVLDPINEDFITDVKDERGKKLANNKAIFQGETFFGMVALQLGMVDQQGDIQAAAARVRALKKTPTPPTSTNQNIDNMKFENVEALAGVTEATQEQLDLANADMTTAGITGYTIVPESIIKEGETATQSLATANAEVTRLTTELGTATASLTKVNAEKTALQTKLAKFPAAPKMESEDPKTEKTQAEIDQEEMDELPHNKAIANNPLFS